MPRIPVLTLDDAPQGSRDQLEPIQKKRGGVPNIYATFAHSPAALEYLLGGGRALGRMSLDAKLREAVTLALAAINDCEYCAAAHVDGARKMRVPEEELQANLEGRSSDARTQAAIDFAVAVVQREGYVTDEQLRAARDAGFDDGQVIELLVVIAHNLLTNYFNHVAQTDIDFPKVEMPRSAGA